MNPEQKTESPLKFLIADDTELNRTMVTKLLVRNGQQAVAVEDGLQAVEAIQREDFDAILMDVQMPVMDGLEATKKIRQWEKAESKTPVAIIALTANNERKDRDHYFAAGMNGVITKPLDVKTVLPTLRKIIGQNKKE